MASKKLSILNPFVKKALIGGAAIEAVFFIIGMREIIIGGSEEFGGYIFSLVHLPSSLVVAYVFQFFQTTGRISDTLYIFFCLLLQLTMFTLLLYMILRFFGSRVSHRNT
jgi:hypothetical protein